MKHTKSVVAAALAVWAALPAFSLYPLVASQSRDVAATTEPTRVDSRTEVILNAANDIDVQAVVIARRARLDAVKQCARAIMTATASIREVLSLSAVVPERDSKAQLILAAVSTIDAQAIAIGRQPVSEEIRRCVRMILASAETIRLVVDPDPGVPPPVEPPPPGGGGGTTPPPPPTGPWCQPSDVGAPPETTQILTSQFGWSACGVAAGKIYQAYDNAILNTMYNGCPTPLMLEDCILRGIPNPTTGAKKVKWCERAFDVGADGIGTTEACTFEFAHEEHGNYFDAIGGHRWINCLFRNIGSQGIQLVYATPGSKREHETRYWNPLDPAGSTAAWKTAVKAKEWEPHWIFYSAFDQVGLYTGTRPSYAISAFEGGPNPLRVERCYLKTYAPWVDANQIQRDCFGAVMAHSRLRFEMFDTYIEYKKGDRDVVQVWRCGDSDPATIDVYIRGGGIWAAQHVDIRPRPGDRIVISGVKGDAPVMISFNDLYTWETSPTWDWDKVIYQGVISTDLDMIAQ